MATAKKLPSGNYRVRVYDKETGKYKSFTAPTKREAERMASNYLDGLVINTDNAPTFGEAAQTYIDIKSKTLSPTTIQGYEKIKKNNMTRLLGLKLTQITPQTVQDWVNELTVAKSTKTVHNIYGLFTAVMSYNDVDIKLSKIRLPSKTKTFKRLPDPQVVIDTFKGSDIEIPVLLGLWCGMRISEILGIRKSDIDSDNILTISRVVVMVHNKPVIKQRAKTFNSNRQIKLPQPIVDLINLTDANPTESIINFKYKKIYRHFTKAMEKQGYIITFHDLRHINASVMAKLNIPDIYAMERGGWSSTNTLKGVYQQTFDAERRKVDEAIDNYFSNLYDTKYDTNKNNPRNIAI